MKFDKYASEPTAEIDRDVHAKWLEARKNAALWKVEEERLRAKLQADLGDATAGVIDGRKVLTHRPTSTYRVKDLLAQYPDLTQHYMVAGPEVFDVTTFVARHPDIAEQFQSRSFRPVEAS